MWTNPKKTADLFTFTKEIPNEKLYFLYSSPKKKFSKFNKSTKRSLYTFPPVTKLNKQAKHIIGKTFDIFLKVHSLVWDIFEKQNLFKSEEKCFLFHVKKFFSWDIYIFVVTFWLCRKRLDRRATVNLKTRLTRLASK